MSAKKTKALLEFSKYLTPDIMQTLINALNIPSGLCQNTDPIAFLHQLEMWSDFSASTFLAVLKNVCPILIESAQQLPWMSTPREPGEKKLTIMAQFVEIISSQLLFQYWKVMLYGQGYYLEDGSTRIEIFRACLKTSMITNDLATFSGHLDAIERYDLVQILVPFRKHFENMQPKRFIAEFKKEALKDESADIEKWHGKLCEYTCTAFEKIEPILGSSVSVSLEEIYTPLTVIEYNPHIQKEQESGKTEIDLLRNLFKENIENHDILEKLTSYNPGEKKALCLIGNPGCGKTWLCNRIALMFGKGHLPQFPFSVSIPCRSQDWHSLEEARIGKGQKINSQSLQDWLLLGMLLGAEWTEELAEHLVKTDGEGLLIVIDSVDEFTKKVPIENTILSALLLRRTLTQSTLLVTSRPAAWNQASSKLSDLRIDKYYQVLGFSPANRDVYIAKRLELRKLKLFQRMLALHEEISLLSLVPVNASLFTALFQLSDDMSASTLTQLYTHLFHYLIRRQLSRMKLNQYAKVEQLFQLNEGVLKCLYAIGEVAYLGVSARELTSTARIPLRIVDENEQDSECLGLAQVHLKETTPGVKTEMWCFSHLTLQEFSAALYLYYIYWKHLCILTRYMVSSPEVFNIYRMVIRFCCGLLCDDAASVLPIVFRHQLTYPLAYNHMPLNRQLDYIDHVRYDSKPPYSSCVSNTFSSVLNEVSGWFEFTTDFVSLTTLIAESHQTSLYSYISKFLRDNLFFYFKQPTPLNEWNNFVASLPHINKNIQVIYIDLKYVTPEQLQTLLQQLSSCSVSYLALYYSGYDPTALSPICDVITQSDPINTRISIQLWYTELTEMSPVLNFLTSTDSTLSSICLLDVEISENYLNSLANRMPSLQSFYFYTSCISTSVSDCKTLLRGLSTAVQLQGFHYFTDKFPGALKQDFESTISGLTALREISCQYMEHAYSILPQIQNLSQLRYLNISPLPESKAIFPYSDMLPQLLDRNKDTLKGLRLSCLHNIGFHSLTPLLESLRTCTALSELTLTESDISLLLATPRPFILPSSLVLLRILGIKLEDSGVLDLCKLIVYHPAIRVLDVFNCGLTSMSCEYLCNLIPTLRQLRQLTVYEYELNKPDVTQLDKLKITASLNSIEFELSH